MFELSLFTPEEDVRLKEAAYALKNCLGQLIKKDRFCFLTLLAVELKLQIERPDLIEEREAFDATEITMQLLERFKKANPDSFAQVIDTFFEDISQNGFGKPPKEITNHIFMLSVINLLRDEMKKKKTNIVE